MGSIINNIQTLLYMYMLHPQLEVKLPAVLTVYSWPIDLQLCYSFHLVSDVVLEAS